MLCATATVRAGRGGRSYREDPKGSEQATSSQGPGATRTALPCPALGIPSTGFCQAQLLGPAPRRSLHMGQGNNCETTNMTTGVQLECHPRTSAQTRPENRSPAAVPRHEVQHCFVSRQSLCQG